VADLLREKYCWLVADKPNEPLPAVCKSGHIHFALHIFSVSVKNIHYLAISMQHSSFEVSRVKKFI
jgi:hypothetical protein